MNAPYTTIDLRVQGPIALLTFNRPDKRNAMDAVLLAESKAALGRIEENPSIRALVLTGAGAVFSAGADRSPTKGIEDIEERNRIFATYADSLASQMFELMGALSSSRLVSISAVNGHAVGGGWMATLCCDFRVAASAAECWMPEIALGRAIGQPPIDTLSHFGGPAFAKEAALTGRRFNAFELKALGLVHRVVDSEAVVPEAIAWAESLCAFDRKAVEVLKERTREPLARIWTGANPFSQARQGVAQ